MQVNMRRDPRRSATAVYAISWQDDTGETKSAQVQGIDISNSGIRVKVHLALALGINVFIEAPSNHLKGESVVRHCTRQNGGYCIGLEFGEETRQTVSISSIDSDVDYYEFLQVNPKAEPATIHRLYRFMASRFHPDNPATGDPEKFLLLNRVYEVLGVPERRALYDATREKEEVSPDPIFESGEFLIGIEGEVNRRLGVLSLLYNRRRTNPERPRVSLNDLEKRMGWPREYLDFTTWYLRAKKYITCEDNSDFSLTAAGVDYVEENYVKNPMLNKLIESGVRTATSSTRPPATKAEGASAGHFILGPGTKDGTDGPARISPASALNGMA